MATEGPGDSGFRRTAQRNALYVVAGSLIAGAVAYAVYSTISTLEEERQILTEQSSQQAVVASRDLTPGTVLDASDLTMGPQPRNLPADQAFTDPAVLVGQTIGDLILRGEAIRPQRLATEHGELRIDQVIDPVSRGVTIQITEAAALGGNLRPGHFVDVVVTIPRDMPDGRTEWVTEAVLQGVRVLAIDQEVATSRVRVDDLSSPQAARSRQVTLEVEPAEAKGLIHAGARGNIHLVLRPADNLEVTDYGPVVATSSVVGIPEGIGQVQTQRLARKREITDRTAQALRTMEIVQIRGGQRTISTVPAEDQER